MRSAFGVDHGEVSKARVPRPPRVRGKKLTPAQQKTKGRNVKSGPQKIGEKLTRATQADVSLAGIGQGASKTFKNVGGFLEKRPGLTGTALVGGGGAAGYKLLSDKEPRKKRS
jgi:hypothetical protein